MELRTPKNPRPPISCELLEAIETAYRHAWAAAALAGALHEQVPGQEAWACWLEAEACNISMYEVYRIAQASPFLKLENEP